MTFSRPTTLEFEQDGSLAVFKYFNAMLTLVNFKKKWGFAPKQASESRRQGS